MGVQPPDRRADARAAVRARVVPARSGRPQVTSLRQRPALVDQNRYVATVARRAGHVDPRSSDHEIRVDGARIDPPSGGLLVGEMDEPSAERDMARGVLVEQCVVEDGPEGPDTAAAVNQRDLAQAHRVVVTADQLAQERRTVIGVDLYGAAALKADAQAADRPAGDEQRLGGTDRPLGALGVGAGEHLLRREVRQVLASPPRRERATLPAHAREQPDP